MEPVPFTAGSSLREDAGYHRARCITGSVSETIEATSVMDPCYVQGNMYSGGDRSVPQRGASFICLRNDPWSFPLQQVCTKTPMP